MKPFLKICQAAAVLLCALCAASCSGVTGYSVVLWTIPEYGIADGTVVPVFLKSNISQVYVIETPGSGEKIEVPLWKLSAPEKRARAEARAASFAEFEHQYAKCVLDGLPIRAEAVNTSKQVYRLRKDEIIRVLSSAEGQAPTSGSESLEGTWLRVLTKDGTFGWCFSLNLRVFSMNADGTYGEGASEAEVQEADSLLEQVLVARWYPDYYASMIQDRQIDLTYMQERFGFDTGASSGTVSLVMDGVSASAPFAGVTKTSGMVYKFNDAPFQMTVRSASSIVIKYTDERGMPKNYQFITLPESQNVADIIATEIDRRQSQYAALRRFGPDFTSSNYGTLSFTGNGGFTWTGYSLLVPSVIAEGARSKGTAGVQYFLPASLKKSWDGVLTFRFDGMRQEVNFLYRKEANGLRLSLAHVDSTPNGFAGRRTPVVSESTNSLVIFFQN